MAEAACRFINLNGFQGENADIFLSVEWVVLRFKGTAQYLFQGDMCTLVIHFNFYAPLNKYTTFVCMRTSFLKFGKLKSYSSILCREMKMRLD